jgi:hypothetical protein
MPGIEARAPERTDKQQRVFRIAEARPAILPTLTSASATADSSPSGIFLPLS